MSNCHIIVPAVRTKDTRAKPQGLEYKFEIWHYHSISDINVINCYIIVRSVRTEDNTRAKPQGLEYKSEIHSTTVMGKYG